MVQAAALVARNARGGDSDDDSGADSDSECLWCIQAKSSAVGHITGLKSGASAPCSLGFGASLGQSTELSD